ncbi:MAG: flagellar hook-associated protein FlgK [Syntrophobacterales bacterium]|nr:MAG: flagellar hook-associated protein FlgK [Syntrophobacterales bacterium]
MGGLYTGRDNMSSILNIAKEAMFANQTAINLTGSNIANVNTPGYTRQRPLFGSLGEATGQVGLGVGIEAIERVYDSFLEVQINEQRSDLGYNEAKKNALDRIEVIFNEANNEGVSAFLDEFWNAWEDLSINPSGSVAREALLSDARGLASIFRSSSEELTSVQQDANSQIEGLVDSVNSYLSDIAVLNDKIAQVATGNEDANALMDSRAELLGNLAEVMDFNSFEDSNGSTNIFLLNGMMLVSGNKAQRLDTVIGNHAEDPSFCDVVFEGHEGDVINGVVTGGQLAGVLSLRDELIGGDDGYMSRLDDLAVAIVDTVNGLHESGFDMYGNLGGTFFDPVTKASDMCVSADIENDINRIAAAQTVNGDGALAAQIGALREALVMNGGTATFGDEYAAFVGCIGQDASDATRNSDRQTSLLDQLTTRRESISGVSIDEEMVNLIKYQTGYSAAARLCTVAQELKDTLLALGQ